MDVFAVHLDKHRRHEMPWPEVLGRAHNPEVTGSNPVPATRSTSANEEGACCRPLRIPSVFTRIYLRRTGPIRPSAAASSVAVLDRDSEALIDHAAQLGDLTEAILATGSASANSSVGEPSAGLRATMADSVVLSLHAHLSMQTPIAPSRVTSMPSLI